MSREEERGEVDEQRVDNTTRTDDAEVMIETLADRVTRLEDEITELVDQVDENRVDHEKKLAKTNKRITKLEERTSRSALALECELTAMERYLTDIEGLSPRANASTKRAVALARNWHKLSRTIGGGSRQVANIKRDNLIAWLEEAMANEEGGDVSYAPKQVHRAMETFADLFDTKAEFRKGKNGARELVIDDPDVIIWSPEDLDAELRQQSM